MLRKVAIGAVVGVLVVFAVGANVSAKPADVKRLRVTSPVDTDSNDRTVTVVGTIQGSGAGRLDLPFTIENVGHARAKVTITSTSNATTPFAAVPVPGATFRLAHGESASRLGGITWTALSNADLGRTISVTYTITAT